MNEEPVTLAAFERASVRFGKIHALDNVSLEVPRGSVYALLGRNGAGKSTAVACLLGQRKPDSGRSLLFGESSWEVRADAMAKTGVVPEEPDAPPEMSARQLSRFCARLYPWWDSSGTEARFERLGIPPGLPFAKLSKGQKGQVQLALALGHRPELLVLDDPTLGLDAVARMEFFDELIGELAERRTTVFLTTHDLAGIEGIADRIGILKEGRLEVDEDLEKLKSRLRLISYKNEITEKRTDFGGELDEFEALRVRVRGWGIEAAVADFSDEKFERFRVKEGVVDAAASAMSLEEIFILVAGESKGWAL